MTTVFEWMLLNGDKLADAIIRDGKIDGPESRPLLDESQRMDSPGRTKDQARKLLKLKLTARGYGNLLP